MGTHHAYRFIAFVNLVMDTLDATGSGSKYVVVIKQQARAHYIMQMLDREQLTQRREIIYVIDH